MSSSDFNYTNGAEEAGIPYPFPTSSSSKKSKTRKVLAVAKRPLRAVGRVVGKGRRASHHHPHHPHHVGYGSIDEVDEEVDDEDVRDAMALDASESAGEGSNSIPEIISSEERRGSFMERVNSYRSGASTGIPGDATPRRGSLTNSYRGSPALVAGAAGIPADVGLVDQRDWVVFRLERHLRQLIFILLAFIIGSFRAEWRKIVQKSLEYAGVAWLTCCVLCVMAATSSPPPAAAYRSRRFSPSRRASASGMAGSSGGGTIISGGTGSSAMATKTEAVVDSGGGEDDDDNSISMKDAIDEDAAKSSATESAGGGGGGGNALSDDELAMLLPKTETETPIKDDDAEGKQRRKHAKKKKKNESSLDDEDDSNMPHPALNHYYCIDTTTGERVIPNSAQSYVLSNEWFDGTMVVMIRTPDVDDPTQPSGNEENEVVCKYMKDKQRRFEFQYQLKLKKLPGEQKIYFSAELEDPVKMGIIQRAFVGAAMAFIKSTNNSFHYSMAGSKEDPDGRWEKPHMSFPVEMSMDRVVVTKPGETPPKLGEVIYEDPESIKNRKKGGLVDWNLEDTYTMALWTAYVDFIEWKVINLPGIRPFELNRVIGPQPILLTLYLIPKDRSAEKHYRRDITQVVELELSNTTSALLGEHARRWVAKTKHRPLERSRSEDTVNEVYDEEDVEEEDEEADDDEEDLEDDEDEDEDEDGQRQEHSTNDLLGDETEYDAADAATAAELGEGMYLRSGDSVVLRESGTDSDENGTSCFVTNGAGFAVLSEGLSSASTIIIQKARRKKHSSKARNELIKSGDTVSIRLVTKGRSPQETETRYLSIHRGWWLKWVNTPPTKNGFFTIYTHETEFTDHDPEELRAGETQSAYLTFGGSFWLRHKRWSQYSVGASTEGSATYGGRVMGLFQPRSGTNPTSEMTYGSDDEDISLDGKSSKKRWMKALQLRAYEASQACMASGVPIPKAGSEEQLTEDSPTGERPRIVFSSDDSRLDVPAWVEVMNRTDRIRQLAYAVRVVPSSSSSSSSDETPATSEPKPFVRFRTGRDLAEIMRVGLSWRSTAAFPQKKRGPPTPVSPQKATSGSSAEDVATPTRGPSSPQALSQSISSAIVPNISSMDGSFDGVNDGEEEIQWEDDSDDEDESEIPGIECAELTPGQVKKKRRIVGSTIGAIGKVATAGTKVAKAGAKASVKAGVGVTKAGVGLTKAGAATGKKVVVSSVKTSVKIGKGTVSAGVSAGKAIIGSTSRSKNPPAREPKAKAMHTSTRWRKDLDLHVAVNKTVKHIVPEQANLFFLAGELAAPEQSYRTVSNVLARMSSIPRSSPFSAKFNNILSVQIVQPSKQDSWFLSGGAMQVGVVPDPKSEATKGNLVCESLVARCLWESHWREEWCGVYKKSIAFYAPLTQKPCLELSFYDVQSVRLLATDDRSPLPGFPILAIETAWQCHYVAFSNVEARESFRAKVNMLIPKRSTRDVQITGASERELWKARFWQGFQNSVESESAVSRGKWAEVHSGSKSISRSILNGRRMDFDLDQNFLKDAGGAGRFVEDLLSTSLSFSLSSLERNPQRLVKFLDAVSHLRLVPIVEIDRRGVDAFCLFVNLYHCLLQHSLLLAVNGPLHRRTVGHFMRASCYEIGGDVFSLAEIQSCIIRGNMSRPVNPKPPYVDVSKKSNAYRFYALKYTDPRVNFVLNTADISCPQDVPILRPETIEEQLSTASVIFLESQLSVDVIRRCVLLPKVCEVYKNDFEDDASGCLYFCSRYLDQATVNALKKMLREETTLTIKYHSSTEHYHTKLILRRDVVPSSSSSSAAPVGGATTPTTPTPPTPAATPTASEI